jgi:hypothetical protein
MYLRVEREDVDSGSRRLSDVMLLRLMNRSQSEGSRKDDDLISRLQASWSAMKIGAEKSRNEVLTRNKRNTPKQRDTTDCKILYAELTMMRSGQ